MVAVAKSVAKTASSGFGIEANVRMMSRAAAAFRSSSERRLHA